MGARVLTVKSNSRLVTRQVNDEYQAKDPYLTQYLSRVKAQAETLEGFILLHVPREQNERANLQVKLAITQKGGLNRRVIQKTLNQSIIENVVLFNDWWLSWRDPIIEFLSQDKTLEDPREAQKMKREALKYCLGEDKVEQANKEVHEGACESHIGGRALASKIARAGFYWPTIKRDNITFVKKCDKCHRHVDRHQAPSELLHSMTSLWPFYMWGVDILGHFPLANTLRATVKQRLLIRRRDSGQRNYYKWSGPTTPHLTRPCRRPLFCLTFEEDAMIPMEVEVLSPCATFFQQNNNEDELRANLNLLKEDREMAHIRDYAAKARAAKRHNSIVFPQPIRRDDLVLRGVLKGATTNKLAPN
ncbi:hypothetical protein CR513_32544, partial [Mucuna pruriens]